MRIIKKESANVTNVYMDNLEDWYLQVEETEDSWDLWLCHPVHIYKRLISKTYKRLYPKDIFFASLEGDIREEDIRRNIEEYISAYFPAEKKKTKQKQ